MDAKYSSVEQLPLMQPARTRRLRRTSASLVWLALCLLLFQAQWLLAPFFSRNRNEYISYPGERIKWKRCGELGNRPLECSSIDVPMDQFNSTNSGDKTFNIPLIRLRGANGRQNLLINPGGPGGSGISLLYRHGERLNAVVGEGFHLLGFDPRGVNSSTPTASCYPSEEIRREFSDVRSAEVIDDSPELYAWTQNLVKTCMDTMGDVGKYINTPQTAADMNSILDAVGQRDMAYWGFSYGTILGQTYATLFPSPSHRIIIDGVANQFNWYESFYYPEVMVDTEKVLGGFYEECIKSGPEHCALASVADSKEKLSSVVAAFMGELKEQPISVYVNTTVNGLLTFPSVWFNGVFLALYKPESWYSLAENLAKLLHGNATAAFLAYGRDKSWNLESDAMRFVALNDARSGPENWAPDRQFILDQLLPFMNQSSFSPAEITTYYAKQQWLYPKTHDYVPQKGVKTAEPLLILTTTYDPVCPLVSAKSAKAAFEGSQIVEVKGYGHCSMAVTSMCVVKHVRAFLYEGRLPTEHTRCEVDSPYFVKPGEDSNSLARSRFEDLEEQSIHAAQLELARENWGWSFRR